MLKSRVCIAAIAIVVAVLPGVAGAQDRRELPTALDAFVRKALDRSEAVPGLAVAVVDRQGRVHAAGYGFADAETGTAVTPETRFYIASATKSFTALAIAAMAARGEVGLDDPLSAWSSGSALPEDIAGTVSLTDLLSHRSGIQNDAIAFRLAYSGDWSPQLLWGLTAETEPNIEAPRGTFDYTNAGYNLATVLIERRWGRDWRALVEAEVLEPLGMARTTARIDGVRAEGGLVAAGHFGRAPGRPERAYLQKTDATMQSAGGLVSTADDMAIWLEVQINDGVVGGRRVLPAGLVASTHAARVVQDAEFGPYVRTGYGLGWQVGRYGDDALTHHFGNFAGSRAHVSFMPERRIGVAVMVNEDAFAGGDLADLVANYVYDWFAGVPDLEAVYDARLTELTTRRDQRRAGLAAAVEARSQRPRTLSLADAAYVGDYVSPVLGTMTVRAAGDRLELAIGVQHALAENFTRPESLRVELTPLAGQPVEFEVVDGRVTALIYEDERFVRR
jgi:CubicO group peptidase (beta-lactamase class C family)